MVFTVSALTDLLGAAYLVFGHTLASQVFGSAPFEIRMACATFF